MALSLCCSLLFVPCHVAKAHMEEGEGDHRGAASVRRNGANAVAEDSGKVRDVSTHEPGSASFDVLTTAETRLGEATVPRWDRRQIAAALIAVALLLAVLILVVLRRNRPPTRAAVRPPSAHNN